MPIIDPSSGDILEKETETVEQEIFWEIFARYASAKSWMRKTIVWFLFFSLILFLTVVAESIWQAVLFFC